jgi:hypothetical protein
MVNTDLKERIKETAVDHFNKKGPFYALKSFFNLSMPYTAYHIFPCASSSHLQRKGWNR